MLSGVRYHNGVALYEDRNSRSRGSPAISVCRRIWATFTRWHRIDPQSGYDSSFCPEGVNVPSGRKCQGERSCAFSTASSKSGSGVQEKISYSIGEFCRSLYMNRLHVVLTRTFIPSRYKLKSIKSCNVLIYFNLTFIELKWHIDSSDF